MDPEAKYTLVGTVVLALAVLLVAAVVWLKGTAAQRDDVPYKIYFAHQSLEGLQIRSDVKMKGIKVGAVTGFRISSRRPGTVEVIIKVDDTTPVRQNTRADVERHLITGIASIRLINPDESGAPLTEPPPDEPYPVIAEGESDYQQISQSMAQIAQRADETMSRINAVLSDENRIALTAVLANLQRISGNVERSLSNVDRTVAAVGRAADDMRSLMGQVASDTRTLVARYDALGAESTTAVRDIAAVTRQLSNDVSRLSVQADALLADGNVELRITARELRTAAESIGVAARRLSDPRKILFGPSDASLGPGEAAR